MKLKLEKLYESDYSEARMAIYEQLQQRWNNDTCSPRMY